MKYLPFLDNKQIFSFKAIGLTFIFCALFVVKGWATIYYSWASGNANSTNTWWTANNGTGGHPGGFSTSGDIFILQSGQTCTAVANWIIGSGVTLQIDGILAFAKNNNSNVTINGTIKFTSTATTQITANTGGGTGTSFDLASGATLITVNQNGILGGVNSSIQDSGGGFTVTLNSGANYEFSGASQTTNGLPSTTVNNLTLSGSGTKTLLTGTTNIGGNLTLSGSVNTTTVVGLTIGGNLNIGDGATFTAAAFPLTVTGTTTVGGGTSGNLTIGSATGTKLFTGLVTIAGGATWNNSGNSAVEFRGGISTIPAFTGGSGVHTFTTNAQALTGTFTIPNVTVTGVTLTNNNTLTVATALSGSGGVTQAASATLNLGGTSGITTLTAAASANVVNYTGAGQTVHSNNYYHLTLSGSGTKTLQSGTTNIGGNLTLSGSANTTTVVDLSIGGNLNIGNGTTFTAAAFALTVTGTTTVGGGTSGNLTINSATGTKLFTGLVTIAGGATWNNSGNSAAEFRGGISTIPAFTGGSGVHTFTTNAQALTGTFTIPNVTVTGVTLTNNNTLTVATALSGNGGLTQAASATLNLGGTSGITTLTATATANAVNYNTGNQLIHSNNYYHLTLSGSGTKTLQTGTTNIGGNFTVDGTTTTAVTGLTIGGDVVLNNEFYFTGGAFTHNVAGNWTINGWKNYIPGTGTINFTGNNSAINGTHTGEQTFNNIIIAKAAGQTLSVGGGVTILNVNGDITLTSGAFAPGTVSTVISGNWTNNGGTLTTGTGIITMKGDGKTIGGSVSTTFNHLTINNNAGGILLSKDQFVNGTLTMSNGLLYLGAYNLTMGATAPAIPGSFWGQNMIIAVGTGELRKIFTANGSYTFPVGDGSNDFVK